MLFLGVHLINLGYTWEKLALAARAIAAVENPADVCVVSARPYAQRALLKFAAHTGATPSKKFKQILSLQNRGYLYF